MGPGRVRLLPWARQGPLWAPVAQVELLCLWREGDRSGATTEYPMRLLSGDGHSAQPSSHLHGVQGQGRGTREGAGPDMPHLPRYGPGRERARPSLYYLRGQGGGLGLTPWPRTAGNA